MRSRWILWVPLTLFLLFLILVAIGLRSPGERTVQSQLIGQPVPEFTLPPVLAGRPGLTSAELREGEPRVVNIFASWCIPCRAEAPALAELERRGIPIDAIAVRDRPEDVAEFLRVYGDPFEAIGADTDRRVQLALGSAGVPETFVIDGRGIIRHQHIGVINPEDIGEIQAAWEAAR